MSAVQLWGCRKALAGPPLTVQRAEGVEVREQHVGPWHTKPHPRTPFIFFFHIILSRLICYPVAGKGIYSIDIVHFLVKSLYRNIYDVFLNR